MIRINLPFDACVSFCELLPVNLTMFNLSHFTSCLKFAGMLLFWFLMVAHAQATALCTTGKKQSPVDIISTQKKNLPAIEFNYRVAPLQIVNDGHTVRVRFSNGSHIVIGHKKFILQQMHFHYPSGDRIAGHEFDLAMHFIHKGADGQLLVAVVLFQVGQTNEALNELLPNMPANKSRELDIAAVRVDPLRFISAQHGYYTYSGSLTAAPCTEGITWLVFRQPLELSQDQLNLLKNFFPTNARAVQPLYGRVIQESL